MDDALTAMMDNVIDVPAGLESTEVPALEAGAPALEEGAPKYEEITSAEVPEVVAEMNNPVDE